MLRIWDALDGKRHRFVDKDYVSALQQNDLESKVAFRSLVVKHHVFPLNDKCGFVVRVLNGGRVAQTSVEVGHQCGDVLGGREPTMNVIANVEEASRCYRYVIHGLAIEGKLEWQRHSGCTSMRVRQHVVENRLVFGEG